MCVRAFSWVCTMLGAGRHEVVGRDEPATRGLVVPSAQRFGLHAAASGLKGVGGIAPDVIEALFQRFDEDGTGSISCDEVQPPHATRRFQRRCAHVC